jgi:hypothetical protein
MTKPLTRAGFRARARRVGLALCVASLSIGSTGVASAFAAQEQVGADKSRPPTFGDCKNHNEGVHNGYDCEREPGLPG